ncbi:MAG: hypothetical protein U0Z26_06290 [Anaerolineales bacterium]
MKRYYFNVFSDYFAIYILDEGFRPKQEVWNKENLKQRISTEQGRITISTSRNMNSSLLLEIFEVEMPKVENYFNLESWDHVVECSIEVLSGKIVILGNDYYPDAPRINLPPSIYHVTVYFGGLNTISEDGLFGNDVYWVIMQPGMTIESRVIKQWTDTEI